MQKADSEVAVGVSVKENPREGDVRSQLHKTQSSESEVCACCLESTQTLRIVQNSSIRSGSYFLIGPKEKGYHTKFGWGGNSP